MNIFLNFQQIFLRLLIIINYSSRTLKILSFEIAPLALKWSIRLCDLECRNCMFLFILPATAPNHSWDTTNKHASVQKAKSAEWHKQLPSGSYNTATLHIAQTHTHTHTRQTNHIIKFQIVLFFMHNFPRFKGLLLYYCIQHSSCVFLQTLPTPYQQVFFWQRSMIHQCIYRKSSSCAPSPFFHSFPCGHILVPCQGFI